MIKTGITDGEAEQLLNLKAAKEKARHELREKIHSRVYLTIMCGPLSEIKERIQSLTDFICNLLGSEPSYLGTNPFFKETVCGLTAEQVLWLKQYYQAKTGKKAEDI